MSYYKDLDEYTEQELKDELERRRTLRDEGKCDYCQQYGNTILCKFPERHRIAQIHWDTIGRFQVPPTIMDQFKCLPGSVIGFHHFPEKKDGE